MDWITFGAILAKMEEELDGAGYFIRLRLSNGSTVKGAAFLSVSQDGHVVRIERDPEGKPGSDSFEAMPHVYVPVASIVAVEGPLLDWQGE